VSDPQPARRLVCVAEGDDVRVLVDRRVEMTLPPTDPLGELAGVTGAWIELRDAGGRPRYRRIVADPLEAETEVPDEPGKHPFTRVPARRHRRAFAILVPDVEDADHVAVLRARVPSGAAAAGPRIEVLARLPLREASS